MGWSLRALALPLALAFLACAAQEAGPDQAASNAWPMRRHDASGRSATAVTVHPPLRAKWQTDFAGDLPQSDPHCPLVSGGRVVAFAGGKAHCLDAAGGQRLWQRPVWEDASLVHAAADSDTDIVVVLSRSQTDPVACALQALSADDGRPLWSREMPRDTSAFTIDDGRLLLSEAFPGKEKHLALAIEDGEVLWEHETAELKTAWEDPAALGRAFTYGTDPPAVGPGRVVFGAYTRDAVYARDPATGELLWRHALPFGKYSGSQRGANCLALANGRVTCEYTALIHSFDAVDPTRGPVQSYCWFYADFEQNAARCAVGEGRVFVNSAYPHWLACLDFETLRVTWKKRAQLAGFPALAGDLLWASCESCGYHGAPAGLRAYDLSGRLAWFTPGSFSEPAVANGAIYVVSPDGVVCLRQDPDAAPFRNLALEPVEEAGQADDERGDLLDGQFVPHWQRGGVTDKRGQVTLRATNTGFVREEGVQVVADIYREPEGSRPASGAMRRRFRLRPLAPGEHADVTFAIPDRKAEPGALYVSCFIPREGEPYHGDNHFGFNVY